MSVERDGGRFRYEVTGSTSDGGARRVVVTNENVAEWVDSAAQPLNAAKRARLRRFVDARVWFPFLPYGLSGSDAHLADGGIEPWNGVDLQRVKVTFAEGSSADADNEYVVWIEPETGRMLYYAYSFDTANDRVGLRFRPLSNFRRVGGLLFYDAENLGFEGGADTSVDRINPEFVSERMEAVSSIAVTEIEAQPIAP
jgi:hypothetical protein